MKRLILLLTITAALGIFTSLILVSPASAWSPSDLPPGFQLTHIVNVGATVCPEAYQFTAPAVSDPFCTDSPTYQQDFDAWVNAHYTPPPSTTTQPGATTTVVVTTTTPATTAAASAPSAPAAPAPSPATTTVITVTTTATPLEQSLQAQIDALTAQIAALTDRVTRLEKAGDASWLAFEQAIAGGADTASAAETARGTWLNVVNQLGAFAPA